MAEATHLDVLIIGAGLSGIDAAAHLSRDLPKVSYAILEQRGELGGTWSLFKYPGLRSDSDMYTLGFGWRPWDGRDAIADGKDILRYLRETAAETGVDQYIQYHRKAVKYDWSSDLKRWTVTVENTETGETEKWTCNFLWATSGYYDYDEAYTPEWEGFDEFEGTVIHPQFWPENLDYRGKKVVVIGSGATAITVMPAMARKTAHMTMLQRTPTWIISQPKVDPIAETLKKTLPRKAADKAIHARYAAATIGFYEFCRKNPGPAKKLLKEWAKVHLPKGFDYDKHLTAPYNPWEQRLCVVPNGGLFRALRHKSVDIVTDTIDHFEKDGIVTSSGEKLEADIVVTATGLKLVPMGKAEFVVDGAPVDLSRTFTYKAMMLSGIPNFAFTVGYTNASWTLKADLVCEYVVRVLTHLRENGLSVITPQATDDVQPEPLMDLSSGYVQRAAGKLPNAGDRDPWRLKQNWYFDKKFIRKSKVDDGVAQFS